MLFPFAKSSINQVQKIVVRSSDFSAKKYWDKDTNVGWGNVIEHSYIMTIISFWQPKA